MKKTLLLMMVLAATLTANASFSFDLTKMSKWDSTEDYSVNTETKTITFEATNKGVGLWQPTDLLSYKSISIVMTSNCAFNLELQFEDGDNIYKDVPASAGTVTIELPSYRHTFNGFNFKSTSETGSIVFSSITATTIAEATSGSATAAGLMQKTLNPWPESTSENVTVATSVSGKTITLGNDNSSTGWVCNASWWMPIWVSASQTDEYNASSYTKLIVRFSEPVATDGGVNLIYGKRSNATTIDENGYTNQGFSTGATEVVLALDGEKKSSLQKIEIKGPDNAVFKLLDAYLANDYFVRLNQSVTSTISAVNGAYVELSRSLKTGWNTVCLPFATNVSSIAADAQLYEFTAATASTITLTKKDDGAMVANTPYFVKLSAAISTPIVFSNVDVVTPSAGSVEHNGLTLHGNYTADFDMTDKYGVTSNTIKKGASGAKLYAYSAYLDGSFTSAPEFNIMIGDETTGISTMSRETLNENGETYNMMGVKVKNPQKGIFIKNGKKYVIK